MAKAPDQIRIWDNVEWDDKRGRNMTLYHERLEKGKKPSDDWKCIPTEPFKVGEILQLDFGSGERSRHTQYKIVSNEGGPLKLERVDLKKPDNGNGKNSRRR